MECETVAKHLLVYNRIAYLSAQKDKLAQTLYQNLRILLPQQSCDRCLSMCVFQSCITTEETTMSSCLWWKTWLGRERSHSHRRLTLSSRMWRNPTNLILDKTWNYGKLSCVLYNGHQLMAWSILLVQCLRWRNRFTLSSVFMSAQGNVLMSNTHDCVHHIVVTQHRLYVPCNVLVMLVKRSGPLSLCAALFLSYHPSNHKAFTFTWDFSPVLISEYRLADFVSVD